MYPAYHDDMDKSNVCGIVPDHASSCTDNPDTYHLKLSRIWLKNKTQQLQRRIYTRINEWVYVILSSTVRWPMNEEGHSQTREWCGLIQVGYGGAGGILLLDGNLGSSWSKCA